MINHSNSGQFRSIDGNVLKFSYDYRNDLLTIDGVPFAGQKFREQSVVEIPDHDESFTLWGRFLAGTLHNQYSEPPWMTECIERLPPKLRTDARNRTAICIAMLLHAGPTLDGSEAQAPLTEEFAQLIFEYMLAVCASQKKRALAAAAKPSRP